MIFALGLKVMNVILINRNYGGMIRMTALIVKKCMPYLLIFIVMTLSFASFFHGIFFEENAVFEHYDTTLRTLFDFTLGNVDFTLFTDDTGLGM